MFLLKKKLHRVEGPVVFFQFWFFQKLKTRIDLNWHWINLKALLHPVVRGLRSCGRVPSCQAWRCLAYSERAPGVLIVAARSQRKTGRPVFRLRATRRVCDQQKKSTFHLCASHYLAHFWHANHSYYHARRDVREALPWNAVFLLLLNVA